MNIWLAAVNSLSAIIFILREYGGETMFRLMAALMPVRALDVNVPFFSVFTSAYTVIPRFSAPGRLLIQRVSEGALIRAGRLYEGGAYLKMLINYLHSNKIEKEVITNRNVIQSRCITKYTYFF